MPDKTNKVIERAYKAFVPGSRDRKNIDRVAEEAKSLVSKKAKDFKMKVNVGFGGSYAKGTWIRGESDVDLFVSFGSEKEVQALKKLVPKGFSPERGTRVYFRGRIGGTEVEVVPVVRFKDISKVENSVDLSVLHADYVRNKLDDKTRKDVIVLKRFCKANGCYGSETYLHGFSGYSLELLVIRYGGLLQLFREVLSWKPGVYIDMEKAYGNVNAALGVIGARESPLILVDPTNPKRNVCGSLSTSNFAKFVFSVKKFMSAPSYEFFVGGNEEKSTLARSKARGTKLFRYSTRIIGPRDRFLSVYNKNLSKLIKNLHENNVSVYEATPLYREDRVDLLLQIESTPVTKTRRVLGPSVWLDFDNFSKFLKGHGQTYAFGEFAAYDKRYDIKNFKGFIQAKIKEYIEPKVILKN